MERKRLCTPKTLAARVLRFGLSLGMVLAVMAGNARLGNAQIEGKSFDHSHAKWDAVLKANVRNGFVDYGGIKKQWLPQLDSYLSDLASVSQAQYKAWNKQRQMAYWFNAYNAFTIKLILDNYPIKSIRKIGLLPNAAFRKNFIQLPALSSSSASLNDIEHEVLRKKFGDPRLHFAVNCASKSCPNLRSEAFAGDRIDDQLDDAARAFLSDTTKNRFDEATNKLYLSRIFSWFQADFERASGSVQKFVKGFLPSEVAAKVEASTKIEHLEYDWSLNGR